MHDAVTVTLIILAAVLLRRPLLTNPDATPGVRGGRGDDSTGFQALAPVPVRTDSPHPVPRKRRKP